MFKNTSKEKIHTLEEEIKSLKNELYAKQSVVFMLEEAIPKEQEARKQYMGDIALFFTSIFKDKLKHLISLQMEELSQVGRTEEINEMFRSNINCFRIIQEWMEEKTKEHLGDLETMRDSFDENEKFISNFKETYGKI